MQVAGANQVRELERVRALVQGAMEAQRESPTGALSAAILDVLRSGEDPLLLGRVYESMMGDVAGSGSASARKQRGSYFTPRWLVDRVLDLTLDPLLRDAGEDRALSLQVLDPACGSGEFLVAAAERIATRLVRVRRSGGRGYRSALREVCARCLHGMDRDLVAVALCRGALERLGGNGCGVQARVVQGDGLLDELPGADVVVGNPPFLNRLERATAQGAAAATRLRDRFGEAARAYTDVAWLFLLRAVQVAKPGGRVGLVLPQSVLGARDATGVRSQVAARASMTDLWLADSLVFGASVHVCVPVFEVGGRARMVHRWLGPTSARLSVSPVPVSADTWAPLGAVDVPDVRLGAAGVVADVAEVTADFRDQYYGLVGCIVEDTGQSPALFAPLVTTGLLDVGRCAWGESPCRFAGRSWAAPRVDLGRLSADMTAWSGRRRRPKVLLATQTRVLEAAVDEHGEWLPVTPTISVTPRGGADLWSLGAILCSPVLTAHSARLSAGTGLSRGVIKLSASQVRGLPMPRESCGEAGRLFRIATSTSTADRHGILDRCGRSVCTAYGLGVAETDALMQWWWERYRGRSDDQGRRQEVMNNPRRSG